MTISNGHRAYLATRIIRGLKDNWKELSLKKRKKWIAYARRCIFLDKKLGME